MRRRRAATRRRRRDHRAGPTVAGPAALLVMVARLALTGVLPSGGPIDAGAGAGAPTGLPRTGGAPVAVADHRVVVESPRGRGGELHARYQDHPPDG